MKGKLELTWVDKDTRTQLEPRVLVEDTEKSFGNQNSENMLIFGDNLLSLKALESDFTGKIKCICIDPPYNTGAAFSKYEDGLEHSKWLSLLLPRLQLLKSLMSSDGVIWISIDDYEVHYLKVLCDEVFGRDNFIACLPTIMNLKGNQDQFAFAGTHEYTLVYAKDKSAAVFYEFNISEEELSDWDEDEIGYFKKGAPLRATGEEQYREDRPSMFFPILIKNGEVFTISEEEYARIFLKDKKQFDDKYLQLLCNQYMENGCDVVLPIATGGRHGRWRWGYKQENIARLKTDVIVVGAGKNITLYKKQRPELGDLPTKKPKTIFYKPEYSSGNGTAQIKKLFGANPFPYPKPEELIADFISLSSKKGDWVLDSFAGSGTAGAVAHKLGRKWIMCEMGEHCHTHIIPRLKAVIGGEEGGISASTGWKGGGGFKYYRLAESLLVQDKDLSTKDHPVYVINPRYDAKMLIRAICKIESFRYRNDGRLHGISSESRFLHVTTQLLTQKYVDSLAEDIGRDQSLLVYCSRSVRGLHLPENIEIKKIPRDLLTKCDFQEEK